MLPPGKKSQTTEIGIAALPFKFASLGLIRYGSTVLAIMLTTLYEFYAIEIV
jgi:hypothetical protein